MSTETATEHEKKVVEDKVEGGGEENGEDGDDDCQYIFPQRLMSILADERNNDSICWLPHGRAFIIRNRKLFAEKVMPRFFPRKSKYSSFTRKLNRWNFVRVSSGPELGAYYHEFFLRDKPHLAAQMFCKNARTKIAMASEPTKVPPGAAPTSNPNAVVEQGGAPSVVSQQQQQSLRGVVNPTPIGSAPLFMMGGVGAGVGQQSGLDPTMQMLLEHQMAICRSQQQQKQHSQQSSNNQSQGGMNAGSLGVGAASVGNLNLFQNIPLAVQQQLLAEKQHQERMIQLRQLMALNLQRQQGQQKRKSNNPRASAA